MTNIGDPDWFGSVAGLLTPVRVCSVTAISLLLYTSVSVVLTVCFPTLTVYRCLISRWLSYVISAVCLLVRLLRVCRQDYTNTAEPDFMTVERRWRDAAWSKEESVEFWSWSVLHKLYEKGTGIGGTWNRNLCVVCRFTVSVSVWVTGTLTLLFFLFQRWSVPSRCQPWTPRSILGFCLLPRVASLTTSLAWDQCLSPAWLWTEDTHQVLWCHHYTSNRAAAKISLKKLPLLRQQVALWPGGNKRCERKLWCLLSTLSYFHVICLD